MIKYFRFIPNLLTLFNLLAGCVAVVYAFKSRLDLALYCVLVASFFDYIDGMMARLLRATSELGKELDSLADIVSFGVAPAAMLYVASENIWNISILSYIPFLIPAFSALRLAKFNIDTRQETDFMGLPTPANALFFISLANLVFDEPGYVNQYIIAAVVIFFSLILISEIKLFSLKKVSGNNLKLAALLLLVPSIIVAIYLTKLYAGVIIIPAYLLISGLANTLSNRPIQQS